MQPPPDHPLVPLPAQPFGVAWPTDGWEQADPAELGADRARLDALLDELVAPEPHPTLGRSFAAAVVAGGRLVAERYGERAVQDLRSLEPDPPHEPVTPDSLLLSWSIAKSITNLAVGAAVADGIVRIDEPVGDPAWQGPDDPRGAITWDDLLTMRPGLRWLEEYYELSADAMPDVVTMLFGEGAADMAAFAADFPLVAEPGSPEAYTYSSGTTNIIAANLQRVRGFGAAEMEVHLRERIFDPIGMRSAEIEVDAAGTFIGSSYVRATLRDWCRFGLLALRGGRWDGTNLVPAGWMDWSRRARSWDETVLHAAQWWAWDDPETPFGAHGFEGQRIIAFPARDVVVLRFGRSGSDAAPALNAHLHEIARCFPAR